MNISRLTTRLIFKDAILISSMDSYFTLPEKRSTYSLIENHDSFRSDAEALERTLQRHKSLGRRWMAQVDIDASGIEHNEP